jgi:hypothetical protein
MTESLISDPTILSAISGRATILQEAGCFVSAIIADCFRFVLCHLSFRSGFSRQLAGRLQ